MKELNTHQRYLIEEFADQYHDRTLGRRDLLLRTVLITGSIPTAAAILASLGCGGDDDDDEPTATTAPTSPATAAASPSAPATASVAATASAAAAASPSAPASGSPGAAVTVNPADVDASDVTFKGDAGDIKAYLARPKTATGTQQAVLVIHDNRGLVEHFKDVSRRFAKEGFVALSIDLLSRNGGTTAVAASQVSGLLGAASGTPDNLNADLNAALAHLKTLPNVRTAGFGVTGFCFGGNFTWEMVVVGRDVAAACPFYGVPRLADRLPETKAAVLAFYGANDARVNASIDNVKAKLAGKTFDTRVYEGAGHAFFQDDRPTAYNAAAATDAWTRMLDWFRKYLPAA